jgi:hypothetical protein
MVRSLDLAALQPAMDAWLHRPPANLRAALTDWAAENKVELA